MNVLKIVFNALEGKFDYISESNGAFQRKLAKNLTMQDGESLVISDYIDLNNYEITLDGDANIHIVS